MDSINIKLLIIQLIGFLGTGFYFLSFQFKDFKKLFKVQLVSYIFYSLHFLLLGAISGALSYIVELIRSYCLSSDNEKLHSKKLGVVICLAQIFVGIFTWAGPLTLLPIIANIAATIAGYTNSTRIVRLTGIFINSPLWIIHNVIVGSWSGVIDETICEISMIISIIRYNLKKTDSINEN